MQYLHLTHGAAVIPDSDGLLLATADERFARVSGSRDEIRALHEILVGSHPVPEAGVGADVAGAVVAWSAGHLDMRPARPAKPWTMEDVLPDHELAAALATIPGVNAANLGVLVSDVLDDASLRAADHPTAAPWLPVHRELGALVAGPVLNGPAPVLTWADVRFRRLAASPAPLQLATLWRTWADHGTAYDLTPPVEAARTAAARLLDRLAGAPEILLTHQVVVPCDSVTSPSIHPVLPVPHGLMAEVPA